MGLHYAMKDQDRWQVTYVKGTRSRYEGVGGEMVAKAFVNRLLLLQADGVDLHEWLSQEKAKRAAKRASKPEPTVAPPTLREALQQWIAGQLADGEIRPGTMKAYESATRTWLFPHVLADGRILGDLQIHQVESEMLQAVLDHVRKRRSRELATHILDPSRTFYAKEVRTKGSLVKVDPTMDLDVAPKGESKAEAFSDGDVEKIIAAAAQTSTRVHAFTLAGLHAGLRWAEINGLQKGDVDFKAHTLSVTRQWGRYTKKADP
jgi:site-specific recombinase XerC